MCSDSSIEAIRPVIYAQSNSGFLSALRKYHREFRADAVLTFFISATKTDGASLSADEALTKLRADNALCDEWRGKIQAQLREFM
jgi:hypothetical protein